MWIFAIGFLAQAFFSARILLQWALSERAGRVLSPGAFWVLSLAGSYLFFVYGWLRDDFAIILGQFISYYIYIWNLREKAIWFHILRPCRWVLGLTPFAAFVWLARGLYAAFRVPVALLPAARGLAAARRILDAQSRGVLDDRPLCLSAPRSGADRRTVVRAGGLPAQPDAFVS